MLWRWIRYTGKIETLDIMYKIAFFGKILQNFTIYDINILILLKSGGRMERDKIKGAIEAILFASGRVVSLKELMISLEIGQSQLIETINEMIEEYKSPKRGMQIVKVNERLYSFKQARVSRVYI